jgi:hypothetical protein
VTVYPLIKVVVMLACYCDYRSTCSDNHQHWGDPNARRSRNQTNSTKREVTHTPSCGYKPLRLNPLTNGATRVIP